MYNTNEKPQERAILVGVTRRDHDRWMLADSMDELELLTFTAGAEVLERVVQERDKLDSAYLVGRGKVEELAQMAKYLDADLIIFDEDLSPAQANNIEDIVDVKVIDRSGLILDIFASRARSREAKTQVELAQLQYLLPRLTRRWTHLERQEGGIGLRGPGETQLEVDRRLVRKRINILTKELKKISGQRSIRRKQRQGVFKAALVGYTNVGKSSLMNALSTANTFVEDQLFATLDATIRVMTASEGKKVLLIDTVGFIRKLPHHLIASFRSTLEETVDADLLLHVIDISHHNYREQMEAVTRVLKEIGANETPIIKVFNKIDLLRETGLIARLSKQEQPCVFVSATRGLFLDKLEQAIQDHLTRNTVKFDIELPNSETKTLSQLYELAEVLNVEYLDSRVVLRLQTTPLNAAQIKRMVTKRHHDPDTVKSSPSDHK